MKANEAWKRMYNFMSKELMFYLWGLKLLLELGNPPVRVCFKTVYGMYSCKQCDPDPEHWVASPVSGTRYPVLRIRSDPEADPDPAIFVSDLQPSRRQKKSFLLITVLFEGTFISFFKNKKSKKITSDKTEGINVFLIIFS
jgi:hypothetical protein